MESNRNAPMGVTIGDEEYDDYRQVPVRVTGFPHDHVFRLDEPDSRRNHKTTLSSTPVRWDSITPKCPET